MKAGTALGLLAGLGAMNAMSGKPYGGKRFTGLMDMLDGGGAGASGDKFEGGGLLSMLGNLFMKPMQAQQNVERIGDKVRAEKLGMTTGTPITEYSDSLLPPVLPKVLDQAPVGTGNPLVDRIIQDRKEQVVMDQPVLPADFVSPASPNALSGGIVQPMPASSQEANISAGGLLSAPDMPVREGLPLPPDAEGILAPELPASERNTKLVSFNRRMETVPEMFRGSQEEGMYLDYLLNGGLGTFAQFIHQSMATEDPTVKRSPTPPALTSPNLPEGGVTF